jgi:hypothetical protein
MDEIGAVLKVKAKARALALVEDDNPAGGWLVHWLRSRSERAPRLVVHTDSGEKAVRVHDLRARTAESDCPLIGLLVGRGGMLAHLAGRGVGAGGARNEDVAPREAITHLEDAQITIRG